MLLLLLLSLSLFLPCTYSLASSFSLAFAKYRQRPALIAAAQKCYENNMHTSVWSDSFAHIHTPNTIANAQPTMNAQYDTKYVAYTNKHMAFVLRLRKEENLVVHYMYHTRTCCFVLHSKSRQRFYKCDCFIIESHLEEFTKMLRQPDDECGIAARRIINETVVRLPVYAHGA